MGCGRPEEEGEKWVMLGYEATVAAVCRDPALHIAIPERPSLGLTLDLEEIARHPYQQTVYLPLFRVGWERRAPNVAGETP
jgi:hypothetical protein